MGLDTIRKAGQWGGAVMFYGSAVVWVRELFTRPDRDVFVDMIGSVVSLHSLYLGAAVGGSILAIGCSLPLLRWIWRTPGRRRKKNQERLARDEDVRQSKERDRSKQIVTNLESLQKRLDNEANPSLEGINHIENEETIRLLANNLNSIGLKLPRIEGQPVNYRRLYNHVSRLLPRVRLYGIEHVISGTSKET